MTNKEAYQLIESCLEYDKDMSENPEAYENAIRLAKEVFGKQDPMKVTGRKSTYPNEYGVTMVEIKCPNCESFIEFESLRCYEPEYCDECGQKLDWTED